MNANLQQIAAQFVDNLDQPTITPLGNGLINDTYLVQGAANSFILQRINPDVFPQPEYIMDNLSQLARHIRQKPSRNVFLRIPNIIPTRQKKNYYQDSNDVTWRALEHIYPAESRDHLQNRDEAAQIGSALGHFHNLCSDLSPALLHDTLPGFHITPRYLAQYRQSLDQLGKIKIDDEFKLCCDFIESHQDEVDILENAKERGELSERVIHGDPKLNNFLFKPNSHKIISLIDLDTVKPGLLHYDIADCLRSCCHDKRNNHFDIERCRIILQNYLRETRGFFTASDYDYLYPAIWLIPFELGLRFFTDYLNGNRYFKTSEPRQNLKRAQGLFALCDSIQQQQTAIERCISKLKLQ